ncbi:MAG: hypothetical protein ACKO13_09695 [Cytophagales bacterium]
MTCIQRFSLVAQKTEELRKKKVKWRINSLKATTCEDETLYRQVMISLWVLLLKMVRGVHPANRAGWFWGKGGLVSPPFFCYALVCPACSSTIDKAAIINISIEKYAMPKKVMVSR